MRRLLYLLVPACVACETAEPPAPITAETATQAVVIAVKDRILQIPHSGAQCDDDAGIITVRASRDADLVFLARIRDNAVVDAHVWVPEDVFQQEDGAPWVQLVAADVPGTARSCRVERNELICNDAAIVPWAEAGEPPAASFRVKVACLPG